MKLFFPKKHYDKNYRRHVFALLKPFLRAESFTDEDRQKNYGVSEKDFTFTDSIEDADLVILTMSWLYYKITDQIDKAIVFIKIANKLNKKVLLALPSDFGLKIPKDLDVIIVREQGYKTRHMPNHYCVPVFVEDPLIKYYQQTNIITRNYNEKPTVGFCGQADGGILGALKEFEMISARNVLYYLGIRAKTPHKLLITKRLRFNLLKKLETSSIVKSNFIIRKKHRAGIKNLKERDMHQSTFEFFDNIRDSDYVLCARGVGNFSVRFYETLAMGRIPIFVDTDCMLPHDELLNWKDHVVWVDYNDRHRIAEIVSDFHSKLDQEKLNNLFKANRKLWEEKLKLKTYFKTLFEYI